MAEPARKSDPQSSLADPVVKLLASLAGSARSGASQSVAGTAASHEWGALEGAMSRLMRAEAPFPTSAVRDATADALRRKDQTGKRSEAYAGMAADLVRMASGGVQGVPSDVVARHLHHALLWYSAWHLLAAGLSMAKVIAVLSPPAVRRPARPTFSKNLPDVAIDHVRRTAVLAGGVVTTAARATRRRIIAFNQARAAERAAAQAARTRHETAAPAAEPAALPSTAVPTLALDGRRLRRSVFGTWLTLVVLSWVSLLWGALISLPIGVGFGVLATFTVSLITVPLWGTIWGFLGMGMARDSTLRQMGFKAVPAGSTLHATAERYARHLGLPTPKVGIIPAFNAFAMGMHERDAAIAIGEPLIHRLSAAELDAVIGHELGHVASGDMRRMMLMRTFQNATVWFGLAQGVKQFARWIICWAAELFILAFSRRREYVADAIGAALAGKEAMIGALNKLEDAPRLTAAENTHARFMFRGRLGSTHPATRDRIQALEKETYIQKLPRTRST